MRLKTFIKKQLKEIGDDFTVVSFNVNLDENGNVCDFGQHKISFQVVCKK